eukprot:TRINITY_DN33467_c0_g1_i1.p1 TRINITY_DN33467_c0_g1~~TRINITY_DN33467_c0_g1_i1.p1  ORF type:complete len:194 (+),score=25.32 TRINITY_DN33467_c0_g1_i1:66-647(+)
MDATPFVKAARQRLQRDRVTALSRKLTDDIGGRVCNSGSDTSASTAVWKLGPVDEIDVRAGRVMCPGFHMNRFPGTFLEDEHSSHEEVDGSATATLESSSLAAGSPSDDDSGRIPWRKMSNGIELILTLREIPDSLNFLDDHYSDDDEDDDSVQLSLSDDTEDSSLPRSSSHLNTMALLRRRRSPVRGAHRKV